MKKDSPLNSGWFYILLAVLLVILGAYLKLRGSEAQVMVAGVLLQVAIIVTLWQLFFKRKKKSVKR